MHHSPGILEKSCCPSSTSPVTWMINDDCWRNDKFVRIFFVLLIRLYMSCIYIYIYIIYIYRERRLVVGFFINPLLNVVFT